MLEKETAWRCRAPFLAILAAAILAYGCDRQRSGTAPASGAGIPPEAGRSAAPQEGEAPPPPPGDTGDRTAPESSAVYERPVPPRETTASGSAETEVAEEPPRVAQEPLGERRDTAACLRLDAIPTHVEAHRGAGSLVQLTVTARNSCGLRFEGRQLGFRISATSPDGFELASAVGRFTGDLQPYGTAETTVDLLCDATRVARYAVQPH